MLYSTLLLLGVLGVGVLIAASIAVHSSFWSSLYEAVLAFGHRQINHGVLPVIGLLGVLVLVAAFVMRPAGMPTSITLPIEVIGADGHQEQVTVDITDANADKLYLQVHNITYHWSDYAENGTDPYTTQPDQERYDEKASFRINGGSWIPISQENVTCLTPEQNFGCLNGPIANKTLRLTVAATASGAWQTGTNTIDFRFNGTDGYTSGYRILDLDVRAGQTSVLDETSFTWTDPNTWSAPLPDQSDIDEGQRLWNERNILVNSTLPDAPSITASCSDCHARDGRDLTYFNFSNQSIVTRSEFHGLSTTQGRQIASYIRSQTIDLPSGYTIADAGRPWNPPYQPGPGLDDRPVELWAAGAGIDCVIDSDADAAAFIFPTTTSEPTLESPSYDANMGVDCNALRSQISMTNDQSRIFAITHPDSTLNNREIPTPVQWPDIFEWWPDVHPFDQWDVSTVESTTWYQNYLEFHQDMPGQRDNFIDQARQDVRKFGNDDARLDRILGKKLDYFGQFDVPTDASYSTEFETRYSVAQFIAIKSWEVMHEYSLEGLGADIYGPDGQPNQMSWGPDAGSLPNGYFVSGQDRHWYNSINIFDTSPHKNQRVCCGASQSTPQYASAGTHRNERSRGYWGDIWYDLALTLSPGNRLAKGNDPFDWNYNGPHINGTSTSNINQGVRYFRHYFTAVQHHNRSYSPTSDVYSDQVASWPWSIHTHGLQKVEASEVQNMLSGLPSSIRDPFVEAAVHSWVTMSQRYSVDVWRRDTGNNNDVPPTTYTPVQTDYIGWQSNRADAIYTMMHYWSNRSLDPQVLDQAATWGESMWPNGDWEQWMLSSSQQDLVLNQGWNLISSRVSPSNDSLSAIFSAVDTDLAIVQNQQGDSFDPDSSSNTLQTWDSAQGYRVYMSAERTITVDGSALGSPTLSLTQGWNLVPFYPSNEMAIEDAFASILDAIKIVKDEEGQSYIPSRNLNEIGPLKPGRAYKVYVNTDVSFSYP